MEALGSVAGGFLFGSCGTAAVISCIKVKQPFPAKAGLKMTEGDIATPLGN